MSRESEIKSHEPKSEEQGSGNGDGGCSYASLAVSFLCLLSVACIALLTGCSEKVKPGTAEVKRPVITGVTVTELLPSPVDEYYETSGTVRARTISTVASKVMGNVTGLRVREGDRVSAGQLLITVDDRDVAQRVKAAEKAVEAALQNKSLAEITYQRYRQIYDEKALTQQELDQIETQKKVADIDYERARAGLAEAQVYHGFTRITAPLSGVVTEKKTDAGSMAAPGVPLLTIEDTSSFTLDAHVDERLSGRLSRGMPVEVMFDSPRGEFRGAISEIVPSVDPVTRTFLAKIEMKRPGLKTGQYARVRIPLGKREAILIPKSAIVERGQLTGVYTVGDKGVISYRLIKAGKTYGDRVETLSGLNAKERVITAGAGRAVDGGVLMSGETGAAPAR